MLAVERQTSGEKDQRQALWLGVVHSASRDKWKLGSM